MHITSRSLHQFFVSLWLNCAINSCAISLCMLLIQHNNGTRELFESQPILALLECILFVIIGVFFYTLIIQSLQDKGANQSRKTSKFPENMSKNRYRNIMPSKCPCCLDTIFRPWISWRPLPLLPWSCGAVVPSLKWSDISIFIGWKLRHIHVTFFVHSLLGLLIFKEILTLPLQ